MRIFAIAVASVLLSAIICVLASPVVERQAPQSIAVVLTDLTNTVTPLANQLLHANSDNATQEILTPIINDISTAVTSAIDRLDLLAGQPKDVIMASVDGTTSLAASDIAVLLAASTNVIFTAAHAVLGVADITSYSTLYALLAALGEVVFTLISTSLSLVVGLFSPLFILITPVVTIIYSFGLGSLLEAFGGL